MSRFQDHFKAEILAETFSKIFFSGSAGRGIAIAFVLTYGFLKLTLLLAIGILGIAVGTVRTALRKYHGSGYAVRRRAFREMEKRALRFGDAFVSSRRNGWHSVSISGTGARDGPFELRFENHVRSGAVRIFHASPGTVPVEFEFAEILRFSGGVADFPSVAGFPDFYRIVRTHFL